MSYGNLISWWTRWTIFNNRGIPEKGFKLIGYWINSAYKRWRRSIILFLIGLIQSYILWPIDTFFVYPFILLDHFLGEIFFRDNKIELISKKDFNNKRLLNGSYRYGIDILNGFGVRRGVFRYCVLNKRGFLSGKEKIWV